MRICLFFKLKSLTAALRAFFHSQADSVVTGIFPDAALIARDISACRPHVVIIQSSLIKSAMLRELQLRFPSTVIAAWVDSRIDQTRMNELFAKAREKMSTPTESITVTDLKMPTEHEHETNKYNLTAKEWEVLQLLADGHSYHAICHELMIAYETLRTHLQHLYSKLGVSHLNEAVAKGVREKLVTSKFTAFGD